MFKVFLSVTLFTFVYSVQSLAQNGVLTNAILYYQDGESLKAKTEIDSAVVNEKTKASAKAWYYRGMIYKSIAEQDTVTLKYPKAIETATVSFVKAKSLDKANGEYAQMSDMRLQEQWVNATNFGVKQYQSANYKKAVKSFQLAHLANEKDTTALLYGSYAAIANKDLKTAFDFCTDLKNLGYARSHVYATSANYYSAQNNTAKAQEELQEGLLKNANDIALLQELANLYISSDQNTKAIETLNVLEKAKPNDALVLTNIAVQYQKLNQAETAETYYVKALEKDPQNFISLFNLAGLYVDKGRQKMNAYNSLKPDQFKKQGPALKAELLTIYTKALDYCKKSLPLAESADDQDKLRKMSVDLEVITNTLSK